MFIRAKHIKVHIKISGDKAIQFKELVFKLNKRLELLVNNNKLDNLLYR